MICVMHINPFTSCVPSLSSDQDTCTWGLLGGLTTGKTLTQRRLKQSANDSRVSPMVELEMPINELDGVFVINWYMVC